MDFDRSPEQEAIAEALGELCARHAGPARCMALDAEGRSDAELGDALGAAGFLELATGEGTGPLDAALATSQLAREAAALPVGAMLLVAPMLGLSTDSRPVALCEGAGDGLVHHAPHAARLLVVDGGVARCVEPDPGEIEAVRSTFGAPLGRVPAAVRRRGTELGPGSGTRLLAWWRVALASEIVGALEGALRVTVEYLRAREQFGRPIGSFQAVQHRLAEVAVRVEGSRWLALEAAARGGTTGSSSDEAFRAFAEAAALAAGHAARSAELAHRETHQLSGAIGYTREHDLHVYSMRLQAQRLELGGARRHFRDAAAWRGWSGAS